MNAIPVFQHLFLPKFILVASIILKFFLVDIHPCNRRKYLPNFHVHLQTYILPHAVKVFRYHNSISIAYSTFSSAGTCTCTYKKESFERNLSRSKVKVKNTKKSNERTKKSEKERKKKCNIRRSFDF